MARPPTKGTPPATDPGAGPVSTRSAPKRGATTTHPPEPASTRSPVKPGPKLTYPPGTGPSPTQSPPKRSPSIPDPAEVGPASTRSSKAGPVLNYPAGVGPGAAPRGPTLRPPPEMLGAKDASPPPPKNTLDEVERALSALDGRHHDAARAQRETALAIAARRAAQEQAERDAVRAEKRSAILRVVFGVFGVAVLAGGGWYGYGRYRRAVAADAALASVAQPFVAGGWKAFARPIWKPRDRTEALVGANTCVLAIASESPGNGKLVVERPSGPLTADTSLAFCTCADEQVVVHTDGVPTGGVELLYREAIEVGGSSALAFLSPRPAALPVTETCKVDPLDSWLAAGKGASPVTADAFAPAARAVLDKAGWKLVAAAPPELPFAVVPGSADSCFAAMSSVSGEALSLRESAGDKPLHPAAGASLAIAWCARAAQPTTVWRTGTGAIAVYRTPAGPLGGALGLREKSAGLGLGDVAVWVAPTERAWDASAALMASGIPTADITIPADSSRPVLHSRVVSLTIGAGHVAPVPDELDRYLCAPSLELSPPSAVCVQSLALGWKPNGPDVVGIAESPLPFWMDVLSQVEDRHGLEMEQSLLSLSRRLAADHYEATARTGVLEEKEGIQVVGRAGDDRIVALGILSTPPWVLPYTDGAPWTLDAAPHSIGLADGEDIHLVTRPPVNIPPEVRRTVVFRHRK